MLTEENLDNSIETLRYLASHMEAERDGSTVLVGLLISEFVQDIMFRCDQEFEGHDTIDGIEIIKLFIKLLEVQAADYKAFVYKAFVKEQSVDNPPSNPE